MRPGFKSRKRHLFFFYFIFFFFDFFNLFIFCVFFLSLSLQCKFANSTLLSLLSFSYFITPYDAQASSAFSALIFLPESPNQGFIYFWGEGRGPVLHNCKV